MAENLETFTSSNYSTVYDILLKLLTHFQLTNDYKSVCRISFILFRSLVICKKLKRPGFYTLAFYILLITQDLNKNKKNPEHPFVDIIKWKTCSKFQQKVLNSMVVGAHQSFQLFRQKTWFLGNNRPLP